MTKRLSIIVPTYNMEAYLARCVKSVLRTPSLASVEVIIVNDGSRDRSLRIARELADRYASTVRVIDKPNGNYGSTINAALPLAQGEYVKILDADDEFDGRRLAELLAVLQRLSGVDMVVTPYIDKGRRTERRVDYSLYSRKVYDYEKVYEAERVFADGAIRFFAMHGVTYRTALLREMHYVQSEGISYTDQEWVFYPLFRVRTIAFADIPIYIYNTAREGQTMDAKVQIRQISQLVQLTEKMARYYIAAVRRMQLPERRDFLCGLVAGRMRVLYRKYLLDMPRETFASSDFAAVDARMMQLARLCGIEHLQVPVNNLLKVDLLGYWHRTRRRYSTTTLALLRTAEAVMQWAHALLFRKKRA